MSYFYALPKLHEGKFLRRYKRFFVDVELRNGHILTLHCPNTGSMASCFLENGKVFFSYADLSRTSRKLPGTLELSLLEDGLACLNTQRANAFMHHVLWEMRQNSTSSVVGGEYFDFLQRIKDIQKEYRYQDSRIDFFIETSDGLRILLEVKTVTLRINDTTLAFPDAKTQRGSKHLRVLTDWALASPFHKSYVCFVFMRGSFCSAKTLANSFRLAYEYDVDYVQQACVAFKNNVNFLLVIPDISLSGFALRGIFPWAPVL